MKGGRLQEDVGAKRGRDGRYRHTSSWGRREVGVNGEKRRRRRQVEEEKTKMMSS